MHQGNSIRTLTPTPAAGPLVDDRCRAGEPSPSTTGAPRQRTVISRTAPSVRVEAGAFKAFLRNEVGAARSGRRPVRARGVAVAGRGMRPRGFNAPKATAGRPGVPSRGQCHHAVDSNSSPGETNPSKRARDQPCISSINSGHKPTSTASATHVRRGVMAGAGPVVGFTLSL